MHVRESAQVTVRDYFSCTCASKASASKQKSTMPQLTPEIRVSINGRLESQVGSGDVIDGIPSNVKAKDRDPAPKSSSSGVG